MNRTAEPVIFRVSPDKVRSDTEKEVFELEGVIAALRAERSTSAHGGDNASRNSTEGAEEQKIRRERQQKILAVQEKSKSLDLRGEEMKQRLLTEVCEAMTLVVRHNHWRQTWFEQQDRE